MEAGASRGQLVLTLFMFGMLGAMYIVPREYASIALLGMMIGLGAYVVGSSFYPRWAHGGKPFLLTVFRGVDNSKHVILARVKMDERGARVYECTKSIDNNAVMGYCFDVDYPAFVSMAEEKYPTVMIVKEGKKPEFEPDMIPTDFTNVPVLMYYGRGRLVGFVESQRKPSRWEAFLAKLGKKLNLRVKIPVIRVLYDNNIERETKAEVTVQGEGVIRDNLGTIHIVDIEKEVLLTENEKLRQLLKEMERVFYAPPSMAMRPLKLTEEEPKTLKNWVMYAAIAAAAVVVLLVLMGVI